MHVPFVPAGGTSFYVNEPADADGRPGDPRRGATDVRQEQVIIQVVARNGDEIVAAGTSIVKGLEPGVSDAYQGVFVGDPRRAALTVSAPVSNIGGLDGAPPG